VNPVEQRRAIEALRAGVPNRDAVRALGSAQPHIEERFLKLLQDARDGVASGVQASGWLIAGDFGAGKSHLLEYLQHVALEENFVSSKVVISKETPLHDPAKLYRAAVEAAVVPDKKGSALAEIAAGLTTGAPALADLLGWASEGSSAPPGLDGAAAQGAPDPGGAPHPRAGGRQRADPGLNSRFAATLFLWQRVTDPEVRNRIVSFWSGDPIGVGDLRSWLRAHGQASAYRLESVATRELALQRFRFTPRLIAAAGYAGWILLLDEVELIARYSFRQRARSYAELARWAGKVDGETFPGLTAVFAITSDFATAVLQGRNDEETIPTRLRATGLAGDQLLAGRAQRGMRLITRDVARLRGPTRPAIAQTREQVRALHAEAYRWDPPPLDADQRLTTTSMRQYVRRWINEWDLKRLYPGERVDTQFSELEIDLSESPALETPAEEDAGRGA
jgi:BREX system ATP-binding protein BrxC/D